MKTPEEIRTKLIQLGACKEALDWSDGKSLTEIWAECPRGDWMLWLAKKVDVDLQTLTLAKALCAKTVVHLMKDERSIKAVEVAEMFGMGEATHGELDAAYAAADAAYADADAAYADAYAASAAAYAAYAAYAAAYAAYAAAYAAATAAYAASADAYAASAAAYAASAAAYAAYAADYAAYVDASSSAADINENQKQTSDICRGVLTSAVFEKLIEL